MKDLLKIANRTLLEYVTSGDQELEKQAQDALNSYTRMVMREDGIWRQVLPPEPPARIDRALDTDKPTTVIDREPASPAAVSLPFGTLPMGVYIRGSRYRVVYDRIATRRFQKDTAELKSYDAPIQQLVRDNALKDMLAEEDNKAFQAVNTVLVGQGATVPATQTVQWRQISGGITRETINDGLAIMPTTPSRLRPARMVMNAVTVHEIQKWDRTEFGGDIAAEIAVNGFSDRKLMGCSVLVTIKRDIVPDFTIFFFAEPSYLGKFHFLEDASVYLKTEAFMLNFFGYESVGSAIGNVAAVARADYTS